MRLSTQRPAGHPARAGALRGAHHWRHAFVRPSRHSTPVDVAVPPVTITTRTGIRIHGIQTGVLAVKRAHATLRRPAALRLLAGADFGRCCLR